MNHLDITTPNRFSCDRCVFSSIQNLLRGFSFVMIAEDYVCSATSYHIMHKYTHITFCRDRHDKKKSSSRERAVQCIYPETFASFVFTYLTSVVKSEYHNNKRFRDCFFISVSLLPRCCFFVCRLFRLHWHNNKS